MKQRVVWACAEEAQKLAEAVEDREKTGVTEAWRNASPDVGKIPKLNWVSTLQSWLPLFFF